MAFLKYIYHLQLARAIERLEGLYHGSDLERAKEELRQRCEEIWASKKACEVVSLTGNLCILAASCSLFRTFTSFIIFPTSYEGLFTPFFIFF